VQTADATKLIEYCINQAMQTHTRVIYLYADDNKKYEMHTIEKLLVVLGLLASPETVLCTK